MTADQVHSVTRTPFSCQIFRPRGTRRTPRCLLRRAQGLVKEVANRAGLTKDVTPHVLRHTFAATALQKGISLATVQKILGHDRLQTTAIYLSFTDIHVQEEFERKW